MRQEFLLPAIISILRYYPGSTRKSVDDAINKVFNVEFVGPCRHDKFNRIINGFFATTVKNS